MIQLYKTWNGKLEKLPFDLFDLTHELCDEIPSWNGSCGFKHDVKLDYEQCKGAVKFRVQQVKMHAGIGTHIDAPAHCIPGGNCVSDLSLENLVARCVVIDVSKKVHPKYSLTILDIKEFEENYGVIKNGCFVIVRTGWDIFWDNKDKYRNNLVFPSVSIDAARLLLDREIKGLGIDTLSPDRPEDGFLVHKEILGSSKYIVENIANSHKMPPTGAYSLALPIKTKHGTEAPIRMVGMVFKHH
jgi:kynurenine formamidase